MTHLTPELLSRLYREAPGETELTSVFGHLTSQCACCRTALSRFLADRGAGSAAGPADALDATSQGRGDSLARTAEWVEGLRARGIAEWKRLDRLPLKRRRASIRRANSRYRNPYLVDLFLRASRESVRDDPYAALELAECAHAVALRLPESELGRPWVMTCLARTHGARGNCLRVLGELRSADPLIELSLSLFQQDGNEDPLVFGELLRFAASLRAEQHQVAEAEEALDAALDLYRKIHQEVEVARVLIKKASLLADDGRAEEAIELLEDARSRLDPTEHRQLALCVEFNQAYYLRDLGRLDEARRQVAEARRRFNTQADAWTVLRFLWLEGTIARDLGELDQATGLLSAARHGFLAEGLAYDAATVGLDLALVHLRTGATQRVTELAGEMVPTFLAQDVPREATAALMLFQEAARQERVTAKMLIELSTMLEGLAAPDPAEPHR